MLPIYCYCAEFDSQNLKNFHLHGREIFLGINIIKYAFLPMEVTSIHLGIGEHFLDGSYSSSFKIYVNNLWVIADIQLGLVDGPHAQVGIMFLSSLTTGNSRPGKLHVNLALHQILHTYVKKDPAHT